MKTNGAQLPMQISVVLWTSLFCVLLIKNVFIAPSINKQAFGVAIVFFCLLRREPDVSLKRIHWIILHVGRRLSTGVEDGLIFREEQNVNSQDQEGPRTYRHAAHLKDVGGSAPSPSAPLDLGLVDQRGALLSANPTGHHVGLETDRGRQGDRGTEGERQRQRQREREKSEKQRE